MLKLTPKKRVLFVRSLRLALLVIFGVFSMAISLYRTNTVASATAANTINFQARLQNAAGGIVPDGNYNVEFKLYSASSGGTALWTEDYLNSASTGLQTVNGYLSANLGSITAFPNTIDWSQKLWLTMNIGGTVTTGTFPSIGDGEMNPRLPLTAVPYAFMSQRSAQSDSLTNATNGSNLTVQGGSGQNFVIQDQGASGTYNLLTQNQANNGYIQQQGSSPGTPQTGNFNISGAGIAGTLQANVIKGGSSQQLQVDSNGFIVLNNGSAISQAAISVTSHSNSVGAIDIHNSGNGGAITTNGGNINLQGGAILSNVATKAALIVQGASGQSANLLQLQDVNGTVLSKFDASGNLSVQNINVAAGQSITIAGGTTSTRPASPTAGQVYYDTTTNTLLTYNGSKWTAASRSATEIVAAGSSSQAEKDSADFVGNGTADDVAINAAIAALPSTGGSVVLLDGTYNITATIAVNKSNVTLVGQGTNTILKRSFDDAVSTTNSGIITITQPSAIVSEMYLDGNKGTYSSANDNGIVSKSYATTTRDLSIFNSGGVGVRTTAAGPPNMLYDNMIVSGSNGDGIYLSNDLQPHIINSTFVSNGGWGIDLGNPDSATVSDNFIRANTSGGISGQAIIINSNNITANSGPGINAGGTFIPNITDNTVSNNAGDGIISSVNATISDNSVINNSGNGIFTGNGSGEQSDTISGNIVSGNGMNGIQLNHGTGDSIVSDNIVSSNGGTSNYNGIAITSNFGNNQILNNHITGNGSTGYAIYTTSAGTVLSGNTYSGTGATSIHDAGTGTIYANQTDASGNLINSTSGSLVSRLQADSTNDLLQAQNNSGGVLFGVSSTGLVNTVAGYSISGTSGTTVSCSGGQFLQNQVVQGGITTGGTCASAAAGLTGSGTDGTIAMFSTSGTNLGNSILTQASGTISIAGGLSVGSSSQVTIDASGNVNTSGYYKQAGNIVVNTTTGTNNSFLGVSAGNTATTGSYDSATGYYSLQANTTGANNAANGAYSLRLNTTGSNNTGIGYSSLQANTTGNYNNAVGSNALYGNVSGSYNNAFGNSALSSATGSQNTAIGDGSLLGITTGSGNTGLGSGSNVGHNDLQNASAIGINSYVTQSDSLILGCIAGTNNCTTTTNIGIGNTAPAGLFSVGSSSQFQIDISGNMTSSGSVTITPATTSTTSFQINTTSTTVFDVDTLNGRVGINSSSPNYALDVNGDINSNTAVRVGGIAVCTVDSCTPSSGSGNYIQNSTGVQIGANINIRSSATNAVTGVIQGTSGQTADILQVASWNGTSSTLLASVTSSGVLTVGSSGQFQVDASGNVTTSGQVVLQDASGNYLSTLSTNNVSSIFLGAYAGAINNSNNNTSVGAYSLSNNYNGSNNTAVGTSALNANSSGVSNTAVGNNALKSNTTAGNNSAVGSNSLQANTIGIGNNGFGESSLYSNISGSYNDGVGGGSLFSNTTGSNNNAFGNGALFTNTTGSNNSGFGNGTDVLVNNLQNATALGAFSAVSQSNSLILGCTAGTNGCTTSTMVGIGNTAPAALFSVGSSSQFQIDASGNVTTSGTITIGSGSNTVVISSTGGIVASGTAQHVKTILLTPEYAGAVLDAASDSACTSANNGTMTSGYDATNRMNYYNWTSSSTSAQCYDVVVQVAIPSDFASWNGGPNIQLETSNTSNSSYGIAVVDSSGSYDTNYSATYASPGSLSTSWNNVATSNLSGTYTAGNYLTIKLRASAKNAANLQLGNIKLTYNSKY